MRRMPMLAAVVLSVLAAQQTARACSVCRCGDQSFFINNARQFTGGRLLIAVEHLHTRKSAAVLHGHDDGGHGLAKLSGSGSGQHEEVGREAQTQHTVQLSFKYGLSDRLMLLATAPYVFNRIAADAGVETANGLGDPEVMAIARLLDFGGGAWRLQGAAGGRLPLGAANLEEGAGVRRDQHLQPGSGAWAGIFGVQLLQASGRVPLFLSVSYQTNGSNEQKFAYGNVFRFNAAAQTALTGSFDLIAEVNGRVADYDTFGAEADANSGGTAVYFSPGLRLRFGVASVRSQVQIPLVESLHGEQNEKINLRTGLVWEL